MGHGPPAISAPTPMWSPVGTRVIVRLDLDDAGKPCVPVCAASAGHGRRRSFRWIVGKTSPHQWVQYEHKGDPHERYAPIRE